MGRTLRAIARLTGVAVARAAALTAGVAAVAGLGFGAQDAVLSMRPTGAEGALGISGDVGGLVPGGPVVPLRLTLRNAGRAATTVTTVRATPAAPAGAPTCAARFLVVGDWHGTVTVGPGASARVTLGVRLDAATPDACANASWGLVYSAQ